MRDAGFEVIDADHVAREVVEPGTNGLTRVIDAFGKHLLDESGGLARKALGALVFADEQARRRLSSILHPLIAARTAERVQDARDRGAPMVVYEAPLIVENGLHKDLDLLVVVSVDADTQLERLMKRDDIDEAGAKARIAAQLPLESKVAVADVIIDNSGSRETTMNQVNDLIEALPKLCWPRDEVDAQKALERWRQERRKTQ